MSTDRLGQALYQWITGTRYVPETVVLNLSGRPLDDQETVELAAVAVDTDESRFRLEGGAGLDLAVLSYTDVNFQPTEGGVIARITDSAEFEDFLDDLRIAEDTGAFNNHLLKLNVILENSGALVGDFDPACARTCRPGPGGPTTVPAQQERPATSEMLRAAAAEEAGLPARIRLYLHAVEYQRRCVYNGVQLPRISGFGWTLCDSLIASSHPVMPRPDSGVLSNAGAGLHFWNPSSDRTFKVSKDAARAIEIVNSTADDDTAVRAAMTEFDLPEAESRALVTETCVRAGIAPR